MTQPTPPSGISLPTAFADGALALALMQTFLAQQMAVGAIEPYEANKLIRTASLAAQNSPDLAGLNADARAAAIDRIDISVQRMTQALADGEEGTGWVEPA